MNQSVEFNQVLSEISKIILVIPDNKTLIFQKHLSILILKLHEENLLCREDAFYLVKSLFLHSDNSILDEISELSGILELPDNLILDIDKKIARLNHLITLL